MADADAAAMTEALILSGSEAALGAGEYDRARMLLSLALRIDSHMETLRLDAALGRCADPVPSNPPLLARLLRQWDTLAPPEQREPTVRGCSERRFALAPQAEGSAAPEAPEEPYPLWAAPTAAQLKRQISASLFSSADVGQPTLLAADARGATSCDLLAALVQLLLGAPFAPASSGA